LFIILFLFLVCLTFSFIFWLSRQIQYNVQIVILRMLDKDFSRNLNSKKYIVSYRKFYYISTNILVVRTVHIIYRDQKVLAKIKWQNGGKRFSYPDVNKFKSRMGWDDISHWANLTEKFFHEECLLSLRELQVKKFCFRKFAISCSLNFVSNGSIPRSLHYKLWLRI